MTLWAAWQASTATGILLGSQVPASWSLEFTVALSFIALVVPALGDRPSIVSGLMAGLVSVLAFNLPFKLGLMLAALAMIVATQTISFAWLAKQFGTNSHLLPATMPFERMRKSFTLERALIAGFALIAMGAVGTFLAVYRWGLVGFGDLNYDVMMRLIIPSVTLTVLGMQMLLTGFLASILDLDLRKS